MGGQAVFFEHKFGVSSMQDNSLPAVICRMEKQALDLAKYRPDPSHSSQ